MRLGRVSASAGVVLAIVLGVAGSPVTAGELLDGSPDTVLATVAGEEITVGDLERELVRRTGLEHPQGVTPEQLSQLLDEMVSFRLLVAEARRAGYDSDPDVVAVMERMMVAKFTGDRLDPKLADVKVSDEEVRRHYEANQDRYARPARVRGAVLEIEVPRRASDATREELAAKAAEILEAARELPADTHGFGPLAVQYSDEQTTRYVGGDIGWLVAGSGGYRWEQPVVDAIWALDEPGQLGPVIETESGFWLVKLLDRQAPEPRPLQPLVEGIRQQLLRDKQARLRDEFYGRLAKRNEVEVHTELLAGLVTEEQDVGRDDDKVAEQPPALPGTRPQGR